MHRSPLRLVAVLVFALVALLSFAAPATADFAVEGYCVGANDGGGGSAVLCTPWD